MIILLMKLDDHILVKQKKMKLSSMEPNCNFQILIQRKPILKMNENYK